jgi:peptidyl-prolyl cis-trans isomerase A (cyclophilin A)
MLKHFLVAATASAGFAVSSLAGATVVQFQTDLGAFQVNLYDLRTPETVANFLEYVDSGAYENVVIHRSVAGFVIQGGGFISTGGLPLGAVTTNPAVVNEPVFSNIRGTIAMAKVSGDENSATSQWFFNLVDNSESLDPQNGGFTVFGEVTGSGMDVVDAVAALPVFDAGGALSSLPLQDYTAQNAADGVPVTDDHLVRVTAIVVIDAAADTADGLSPVENTLIDEVSAPAPAPTSGGGGGGGGVTGPASVLFVLVLAFARYGAFAGRRRPRIRSGLSRRQRFG